MTIDSGAGAKLIGVAATIGGLLLALYLGYLVGHQNTTYLAIIGVFVVCLIYLFQVKQHTIPVIIFLVSLDMMYSPGFGITSGELSAGVCLGSCRYGLVESGEDNGDALSRSFQLPRILFFGDRLDFLRGQSSYI